MFDIPWNACVCGHCGRENSLRISIKEVICEIHDCSYERTTLEELSRSGSYYSFLRNKGSCEQCVKEALERRYRDIEIIKKTKYATDPVDDEIDTIDKEIKNIILELSKKTRTIEVFGSGGVTSCNRYDFWEFIEVSISMCIILFCYVVLPYTLLLIANLNVITATVIILPLLVYYLYKYIRIIINFLFVPYTERVFNERIEKLKIKRDGLKREIEEIRSSIYPDYRKIKI